MFFHEFSGKVCSCATSALPPDVLKFDRDDRRLPFDLNGEYLETRTKANVRRRYGDVMVDRMLFCGNDQRSVCFLLCRAVAAPWDGGSFNLHVGVAFQASIKKLAASCKSARGP